MEERRQPRRRKTDVVAERPATIVGDIDRARLWVRRALGQQHSRRAEDRRAAMTCLLALDALVHQRRQMISQQIAQAIHPDADATSPALTALNDEQLDRLRDLASRAAAEGRPEENEELMQMIRELRECRA